MKTRVMSFKKFDVKQNGKNVKMNIYRLIILNVNYGKNRGKKVVEVQL